MRRVLSEPLLHFLLLGLLLLAGQYWAQAAGWGGSRTLVVSPAEQARIIQRWRNETGRSPTAAQRRALVREAVDEEVLVREALRLGLDQRDRVVAERLVKNLQFAGGRDYALPTTVDEFAQAVDKARRLGMVHQDLVIRRRLVQRMRERVTADVRVSEPEIRAWYDRRPEQFARPARYHVTQLYFDSDAPQEGAARATRALARLRAGVQPEQVDSDGFLLGRDWNGVDHDWLARHFGAPLADAVAGAPAGQWIGPVKSAYGTHLLRISTVQSGGVVDYAQARSRVRAQVLQDRKAAALRAAIRQMRARYDIRVPPASAAQLARGQARP